MAFGAPREMHLHALTVIGCAHPVVRAVIGHLAQQVHVKIRQLRRKAIRSQIGRRPVKPRQAQQIIERLFIREKQLIQTILMNARHIENLAIRAAD